MLKFFRSLSIKKARNGLILVIIAGIIAAGLGAVFIGVDNMLAMVTGGPNLADYSVDEYALLEGKVVTFDSIYTVDSYAYVSSSSNSTNYKSTYYSVITPDGEYMMSVHVDKLYTTSFEENFLAQWEEYDTGNYDFENPPETIRLRGVLTSLSSDEYSYFADEVSYWGWDGYGVNYVLRLNYVSEDISFLVVYIICAVFVLILLLEIFFFVRATQGAYQKTLRAYAANSSEPDALEKWYADAAHLGKSVWINRDAMVTQIGRKSNMQSLYNVVWAYKRTTRRNGVESSHEIILNYENGKTSNIAVPRKDVDETLQYMLTHCEWICIGYNNEFAKAFRTAPGAMRNYAYAQRNITPPSVQPIVQPGPTFDTAATQPTTLPGAGAQAADVFQVPVPADAAAPQAADTATGSQPGAEPSAPSTTDSAE